MILCKVKADEHMVQKKQKTRKTFSEKLEVVGSSQSIYITYLIKPLEFLNFVT